MTQWNHNIDADNRLPEWLVEEFNRTPYPTPDIESRFTYMKADFIRSLGSSEQPKLGLIEIIYDITGNVIDKLDSIFQLLTPPDRVQRLLCRSLKPSPSNDISTFNAPTPVSVLQKPIRDAVVQISFLHTSNETEIEIELLDLQSKRIRPFDIAVSDAKGSPLAPQQTVCTGCTAPRFPGPSAGMYIFDLTWGVNRENLTIEIRH